MKCYNCSYWELQLLMQDKHLILKDSVNLMLFAIIIWCTFCTLEVLNDTCGLGIDIGGWYSGARMMAFQLLIYLLSFFNIYSSPEILMKYLKLWAILSLFSYFWTWKQQHLGLTPAEKFLNGRGRTTHLLQGGTLFDIGPLLVMLPIMDVMLQQQHSFFIFGITSKIKRQNFLSYYWYLCYKRYVCIWNTNCIFCMIAGFMVYIVLSKSIKIAIPASIIGGLFLFILAFTNIGQGNQQIRRMRSAFDKNDASSKCSRYQSSNNEKIYARCAMGN